MSLINQVKKQKQDVVPTSLTKSDIEFLLNLIKGYSNLNLKIV